MVNCCSAYGCNTKAFKGSDVSLHSFPLKNPKQVERWVIAMKRKDFRPTKHSQLCSLHFSEDSFQIRPGASKRLLRENAVPSIFEFHQLQQNTARRKFVLSSKCQVSVPHPSMPRYTHSDHEYNAVDESSRTKGTAETHTTHSDVTRIAALDEYSSITKNSDSRSNASNESSNIKQIADPQQNNSAPPCNAAVAESANTENISDPRCNSVDGTSSFKQITTMSAPQKDVAMLTTKKELRRKVKVLQQRLNRRNAKIRDMKGLILNMKKQLKSETRIMTILEGHFSGFLLELIRHTLKNGENNSKKCIYSDTMRQFAVTLFFYSPRAFQYMRSLLHLPPPSTIRRWISKYQCKPGSLEEKLLNCENEIREENGVVDLGEPVPASDKPDTMASEPIEITSSIVL